MKWSMLFTLGWIRQFSLKICRTSQSFHSDFSFPTISAPYWSENHIWLVRLFLSLLRYCWYSSFKENVIGKVAFLLVDTYTQYMFCVSGSYFLHLSKSSIFSVCTHKRAEMLICWHVCRKQCGKKNGRAEK